MKRLDEYINAKTEQIKRTSAKIQESMDLQGGLLPEQGVVLVKECVEMTNEVRRVTMQAMPTVSLATEYEMVLGEIYIASAEHINGITHIHIDALPPLKPNSKFVNDIFTINSTYVSSILAAVNEAAIPACTESSVLCFILNVSGKTFFCDHDNVNIKPIIDGLATQLFEDSSDFLSLFMKSLPSIENSTDIYIVPDSNFASFAARMFSRKKVS